MSVEAKTHHRLSEPHRQATSIENVWPGLFDTVDSPIRAAIARRILSRSVARLPMRIEFPDGQLLCVIKQTQRGQRDLGAL